MTDDFGLNLILAEEMARNSGNGHSPGGDDHENTFVYEETDKTASGSFYLTPEDTGMTVPGPGTLDTLLVIAGSDQFSIAVDTGSTALLDHDYTTLQANSSELSHVAAYKRSDGKFILSASDFPYRDRVSVLLAPGQSITFDRIRATYTLEPGVEIGN